ncbi:MAG: class I SAM-dependent methyltransferase [Cyanobacteria bacterium P01_H01_bin.15]
MNSPLPVTNCNQSEQLELDWSSYYAATENSPPRKTLLRALDAHGAIASENYKYAVDLGCGGGRDTVEMLRRGWCVQAMDAQSEAIERVQERLTPIAPSGRLSTQVGKFESLILPPEGLDLVNASFSLFFCQPTAFPLVWTEIINSLRPGGYFSGQFLGEQDSWAYNAGISAHPRQQIERLLSPLKIESWEEENQPGETALGQDKHWHIFHVVAQKTP